MRQRGVRGAILLLAVARGAQACGAGGVADGRRRRAHLFVELSTAPTRAARIVSVVRASSAALEELWRHPMPAGGRAAGEAGAFELRTIIEPSLWLPWNTSMIAATFSAFIIRGFGISTGRCGGWACFAAAAGSLLEAACTGAVDRQLAPRESI